MVNSVRNCLLLVLQTVRQMVNVTISRSLTVCRPFSDADCSTCTEKPVHVFATWFSTYFPFVCVSTHKINWNFGQCSRFVIAGFLVHSTCLTLLRWLFSVWQAWVSTRSTATSSSVRPTFCLCQTSVQMLGSASRCPSRTPWTWTTSASRRHFSTPAAKVNSCPSSPGRHLFTYPRRLVF